MSEAATIDPNAVTSHSEGGRVLEGVGVSADQLAETMERHAPPEKPEPAPVATPTDGKPADATPSAPLTRGRQRFSDLTREREEARAEAAAAKAERETIARERDELRQRLERGTPPPPVAEPAKPAAVAAPTRQKPTEDEVGSKYSTYADFIEDLQEWKWEQKQATADPTQQIREILAQERAAQQFRSAIDTSQERARKKYPDFDALLSGPAGAINLSRDEHEAIQRVAFIANHPQSEDIQYAILKDPALAQRLQDSDPIAFGATIAGLVSVAAAPSRPAWTPPPAPHPSVGASTPTTPTPSSEFARKGDMDSYRRQRAAERGVKPRY